MDPFALLMQMFAAPDQNMFGGMPMGQQSVMRPPNQLPISPIAGEIVGDSFVEGDEWIQELINKQLGLNNPAGLLGALGGLIANPQPYVQPIPLADPSQFMAKPMAATSTEPPESQAGDVVIKSGDTEVKAPNAEEAKKALEAAKATAGPQPDIIEILRGTKASGGAGERPKDLPLSPLPPSTPLPPSVTGEDTISAILPKTKTALGQIVPTPLPAPEDEIEKTYREAALAQAKAIADRQKMLQDPAARARYMENLFSENLRFQRRALGLPEDGGKTVLEKLGLSRQDSDSVVDAIDMFRYAIQPPQLTKTATDILGVQRPPVDYIAAGRQLLGRRRQSDDAAKQRALKLTMEQMESQFGAQRTSDALKVLGDYRKDVAAAEKDKAQAGLYGAQTEDARAKIPTTEDLELERETKRVKITTDKINNVEALKKLAGAKGRKISREQIEKLELGDVLEIPSDATDITLYEEPQSGDFQVSFETTEGRKIKMFRVNKKTGELTITDTGQRQYYRPSGGGGGSSDDAKFTATDYAGIRQDAKNIFINKLEGKGLGMYYDKEGNRVIFDKNTYQNLAPDDSRWQDVDRFLGEYNDNIRGEARQRAADYGVIKGTLNQTNKKPTTTPPAPTPRETPKPKAAPPGGGIGTGPRGAAVIPSDYEPPPEMNQDTIILAANDFIREMNEEGVTNPFARIAKIQDPDLRFEVENAFRNPTNFMERLNFLNQPIDNFA